MTDIALAQGQRNDSKRTRQQASLLVPLAMRITPARYDRTGSLHNAHQTLQSTVGALAAQAEAVMETADMALSLQLAAIENMDWPAIAPSEKIHRFLADMDAQLPPIDSAFFVDADGFNSASSRQFPMPRF